MLNQECHITHYKLNLLFGTLALISILHVLFQEGSHKVFYWRSKCILLIAFPSSDLIYLLRMWLNAFYIAAFVLHFILLIALTD